MKNSYFTYAAILGLTVLIVVNLVLQNSKTWQSKIFFAKVEAKFEDTRTHPDMELLERQENKRVKSKKSGRESHVKKVINPDELAESDREVEDVTKKFKDDKGKDEKVKLLESLGYVENKKVLDLLVLALDDLDKDVRIAAANLFENFEGDDLMPCVMKAMDDSNAEVRTAAVNALRNIDSPEAANILLKGAGDEDEEVRDTVFYVLSDKDSATKEAIAKEAVLSQYPGVKSKIVEMLVEIPSHNVMDTLINGLKDKDPEFRGEVGSIISFFLGEDFENYDAAKLWWIQNKYKFDNELMEQ